MRSWVSLVAIACMGGEKPAELIMLPVIRAHFCESLAPLAGMGASSNDLFLLGLLSAVDAILDMDMQDVVREITLGDEIPAALLGEPNKLRRLFDLALKYEMGCWEGLPATRGACGFQSVPFPACTSRQWNGPEVFCSASS